MPTKIVRVKGGFQVRDSKHIHAKKTTLKKAKAQQRLLRGISHGMVTRKRSK